MKKKKKRSNNGALPKDLMDAISNAIVQMAVEQVQPCRAGELVGIAEDGSVVLREQL